MVTRNQSIPEIHDIDVYEINKMMKVTNIMSNMNWKKKTCMYQTNTITEFSSTSTQMLYFT